MWFKSSLTIPAVAAISFCLIGGTSPAAADILHVPGDFPTIQEAIDAAVDGDEVEVHPGTYNETIDFLGKAITVRSSDGQEVTIIDAQFSGTVVTCSSGEGPDTVLIGFTITRGIAHGMFNLNSSPTVTNCRFFQNGTFNGDGGGMYNVASGFLDISSPTVTNCTFLENGSFLGGGMYNVAFGDSAFSSPTVTNCRFLDNSADFGGGMYNEGSHPFHISSATVTNCTFSGNSADFGGGMYNFVNSSPTVTNCTFSGNTAGFSGGGMYIFGDPASSPTVTNCILWGNVPDQLVDMFGTVTFSDVQGGWPGTGNIDADPFFIDDDGPDNVPGTEDDNLRLAAGMPCIDAGNNTALPPDVADLDGDMDTTEPIPFDLDGNDRIRDGDYNGDPVVDMGAYEFVPETISVLNVTQGTFHDSIAQAIQAAVDGDELLANPPAFAAEPVIDFLGKAITLCSIVTLQQGADGQIIMGPGSTLASRADIVQAPGGLIVMADDATLTTRSGQTVMLGGELQVPLASQVDVITDQLLITLPGLLTMGAGSVADIQTNAAVANSGSTSIFGTFFSPAGLHNEATGTLTVSGFIVADVTNDNQATFNGDSYVVGDYLNNGTTDIINGTLFIFGTLINNGTINGNVSGGGGAASGPGDDFGLAVSGDYILGQAASHLMPSDQLSVRIEGHYDVAINNNANYDMAQAELRMIGLGAMPQSLEVMSLDIGPDSAGLDRTLPGHYPIGTLRIGPTRTTVNMADVHDNDGLGQKFCEAIYVENLIIEPGATLNTLGCPVYYVQLINNGTVDDPANLIALPPPCPADFDNSGAVGVKDLLFLLGAWGPCPKQGDCLADFDNSGDVGVKDLLLLLGAWGPCP